MDYTQYGEESVLKTFFKTTPNGTVVDVGAADGVRYSNSRYLIESLGWMGVLVEPHPTYFTELVKLYEHNPSVTLINKAVYSEEGELPFYVYGRDEHAQVSTLSENFKNKVIKVHGDNYEQTPIMVKVIKLSQVLEGLEEIEFLSVDCEGVDMEVLLSNDWDKYRPSLVCVEHSMPKSTLQEFMTSVGYKFLTETEGNSFFCERGFLT
jgi:FkbM family methyltransferase